jgi:hypothetical protein
VIHFCLTFTWNYFDQANRNQASRYEFTRKYCETEKWASVNAISCAEIQLWLEWPYVVNIFILTWRHMFTYDFSPHHDHLGIWTLLQFLSSLVSPFQYLFHDCLRLAETIVRTVDGFIVPFALLGLLGVALWLFCKFQLYGKYSSQNVQPKVNTLMLPAGDRNTTHYYKRH